MKKFKLFVTVAAMYLSVVAFPQKSYAYDYTTDLGGYGYQEVRSAAVYAPAVALAVVALALIIAVALQTTHDHTHSH